MGLPGDGQPDFEIVGLSSVFTLMTEKFRADVVRRALTSRGQVSDDARAAIGRSIRVAVNVKGFRDAGIAPPAHLQEPVATSVLYRNDLAGAVLRVWAESEQTLRDLVVAYLSRESLLDGEADYSANTILMGQLDPRLNDAIGRMVEAHTELSKDDLLLMTYYASGRIPANDAEAEGSGSPPAVSDQPTGVFEQLLDTLRALPLDAPTWQEVLDLAESIEQIREAKLEEVREAAELDARVLAIAGQHAALLEFFEWNAEEKLAQRPRPWADFQAVRQVIGKLAALLDEYAQVHPIATSRSEEAKRGPRRAELQERIDGVLGQFEALEVQAPPPEPQLANPAPDRPDVDSPQPEAQQMIYEAELAALRAENERLSAEHQDLESSNRHLTEQVNGLESDFNESRNLAEMWRRSYQDLRKTQGPAVGGDLPDFESVAQVVQLAEKRLTDHLSFPLNSKSDLEIPFDNPRQVWDALEWLATTYYQAKTGENGEPDFDRSLRHACGWRYTPDQSDTTIGQYRDYYETRVGHQRRELREHIGTGNGYHRGTIRIGLRLGGRREEDRRRLHRTAPAHPRQLGRAPLWL